MQLFSRAVVVRSVMASVLLGLASGQALAQRYVDSSGKIRNYTTGGVSSGGTYGLMDRAFDSRATPNLDHDEAVRPYQEPPFTDNLLPVSAFGLSFRAKASASIETFTRQDAAGNFLADGWNSAFSSARVVGLAGVLPESASAQSRVTDPKTYTVGPGEDSVTFGVTFTAGTHMDAGAAGPGAFAATSILGSQGTDMLDGFDPDAPGNLFSYAWNASTVTPGVSSFAFNSNPVLGLDDAGIRAAFLANLVGVDGEFTLVNDFVIQMTLAASEGASFQFGGVTEYDAEASCAPSPGGGALGAIGLVLAGRRRR